jgi:hypothetical protein
MPGNAGLYMVWSWFVKKILFNVSFRSTEHQTPISERRDCHLAGLSRATCRYRSLREQRDEVLSEQIKALAHERRRFGWLCRISDMKLAKVALSVI